jgi:hypothetical protein
MSTGKAKLSSPRGGNSPRGAAIDMSRASFWNNYDPGLRAAVRFGLGFADG